MYAYYIDRGHTIGELVNLSEYEKTFYIASMMAVSDAEWSKYGK